MNREKRSDDRRATITDMTYEHLGVRSQGRMSDLSPSGFFIDTINPLPEGSLISFRFVLPGDDSQMPTSGEGTVV